MLRWFRVATIAAIFTLSASAQALAHSHLQSAAPPDKAVVAAPTELILTFSEAVNLRFSGVKLLGAGKQAVKLDKPQLSNTGKTLTVPVSGTLSPGAYTVDWNILSSDGHKLNGSYGFTVKP